MELDTESGSLGFDVRSLVQVDTQLARYVDNGLLPGWLLLIGRGAGIVHLSTYGYRDIANNRPIEFDTVFRIYSMTKPVTAAAIMILVDDGLINPEDELSKFIPAFADARVYSASSGNGVRVVPLDRPVRIQHLLTHTAGFTYGYPDKHPVDTLYRQVGFKLTEIDSGDLAESCDKLANLPLLFQPGTEWQYSVASDVLGRVVEVVSGDSLDQFLQKRLCTPLNMHDTSFSVSSEKTERLATLYEPDPRSGRAIKNETHGGGVSSKPKFLSGGHGLVSTAFDYYRFALMLLKKGKLDGTRLIRKQTLELMLSNHLPRGQDLESFGRPLFAPGTFSGVGYGFGVSVTENPERSNIPGARGSFGWGGAAGTMFHVDPGNDLIILFLTQLWGPSTHPIRAELRHLVYRALAIESF